MRARFCIFLMSNYVFHAIAFVMARAPKYSLGELREMSVTFPSIQIHNTSFMKQLFLVVCNANCMDCLQIEPAWTVMEIKRQNR